MSLASLSIADLRCIHAASLRFEPGLNLIHGPNGSGKTSVLEAIFLVGRGRSFRTRYTEQLISREADKLMLYAQTEAPPHRIGFEYRRGDAHTARIDGQDVRSLAELPATFFVEAIDPEIHRLVEGAPTERRRWMDWGVFHVEPTFLDHWLRFSRALRQRNAALKQGMDPRAWDQELCQHGEEVARLRGSWFSATHPLLSATIQRLSGLELELSCFRGWAAEQTLAESLAHGLERDRARGSTLAGPQRADVLLRCAGRAARETLSRGQQKLVAASLVLALMASLRQRGGTPPTLLLDDPAAELDANRLDRLVALVGELDCQLVITTLDPQLHAFGSPDAVFHVEQGSVQRL